MSRLSQSHKIVELLKQYPNRRFNARQIADMLVSKYPEEYRIKRANPRFTDEKSFLSQIVAEIGAQKDQMLMIDAAICWQDHPRPRTYWYGSGKVTGRTESLVLEQVRLPSVPAPVATPMPAPPPVMMDYFSPVLRPEQDLYALLIDYLKSELKLYCLRIDERRSKNTRGLSVNQWLHPDVAAIQPLDKDWNELVRSCVKQGAGQSVRLWSFAVKKELNSANVRPSFFQAVSNSSWANEGYLVALSISDDAVEQELRMLSALHGIGIILLNPDNPSESEMMIPARARPAVDWQSVNRILMENEDFRDYIELVSAYYQTGRVRIKDWNGV